MMKKLRTLGCWLGLAISACNGSTQGLTVASSADQSQYAVGYPDALASARQRFTDQEAKAKAGLGRFTGYPDAVGAKSYEPVLRTYELADAAGKSSAYATRYEETEVIETFFTEEKTPLGQAVSGSTHYAAKQNECKNPGDIGGAAVFGMNKAVDKQLATRLRSSDEAHSYIDAHAETLGDKPAEKLREQADELSEVSYLVHVGVERTRERAQQLLTEASTVQSTLEQSIEEAKAQAADASQPEADRKTATARAEAAQASLGRVESEKQQLQSLNEQLEQRIKSLRAEYDQAFAKLVDTTKQKLK